jgi:hypothetical protein
MNRSQLIVCLAALSLLFSGCASEKPKYHDAKEASTEYVSLTEEYCAGIEKAGSAEDAAKVINAFADGLEKLGPKMKKVAEKYPELEDQENIPEEWKASQEKIEEAIKKMTGTMFKLAPYMSDPAVLKAQERMGQIMTSFQK